MNCGAEAIGPYCSRCGQKRQSRILPLRGILSEAFEDYFSFDNRMIRTLRPFLFRPGFLTHEYIAGRRIRYVPPFRLYLIVSLLQFLVTALAEDPAFFFFSFSAQGAKAEEATVFLVELMAKVIFVLLPAFALLLKGLWPRRLFVEHLVFSLHFHAFAFFVSTLIHLLNPLAQEARARGEFTIAVLVTAAGSILGLWCFVYLYLALRKVYGQSRSLTFFKLFLLLAGYAVLLLATMGVTFLGMDWMLRFS